MNSNSKQVSPDSSEQQHNQWSVVIRKGSGAREAFKVGLWAICLEVKLGKLYCKVVSVTDCVR
eukprot:6486295-Amphidinium_carterae.1